jgi:hypothetical protein
MGRIGLTYELVLISQTLTGLFPALKRRFGSYEINHQQTLSSGTTIDRDQRQVKPLGCLATSHVYRYSLSPDMVRRWFVWTMAVMITLIISIAYANCHHTPATPCKKAATAGLCFHCMPHPFPNVHGSGHTAGPRKPTLQPRTGPYKARSPATTYAIALIQERIVRPHARGRPWGQRQVADLCPHRPDHLPRQEGSHSTTRGEATPRSDYCQTNNRMTRPHHRASSSTMDPANPMVDAVAPTSQGQATGRDYTFIELDTQHR